MKKIVVYNDDVVELVIDNPQEEVEEIIKSQLKEDKSTGKKLKR